MLLPCLRSAPAEDSERLAGEAGLGDEGRNSGGKEHQHRPCGELQEQGAVRDQRDEVPQETKGPTYETERAAGGLSPRSRHLVVQLGVLEVFELKRERFLQDHHVDAVTELRPQQGHRDIEAPLQARSSPHQQQLCCNPAQRRPAVGLEAGL